MIRALTWKATAQELGKGRACLGFDFKDRNVVIAIAVVTASLLVLFIILQHGLSSNFFLQWRANAVM